jgi:hypothetical protein
MRFEEIALETQLATVARLASRQLVDRKTTCEPRAFLPLRTGFPRVLFALAVEGSYSMMLSNKGWRLQAWRESGLAIVVAHGHGTAESIRLLRAFIRAVIEEHDDRGVLVDLRGVNVQMSLDEWRLAAIDSARAGFKVPIGFVVAPEFFDFAVQYCFHAADRGQRRMAFTDLDAAFSWALGSPVAGRARPGAADTAQQPPGRSQRLRLVR